MEAGAGIIIGEAAVLEDADGPQGQFQPRHCVIGGLQAIQQALALIPTAASCRPADTVDPAVELGRENRRCRGGAEDGLCVRCRGLLPAQRLEQGCGDMLAIVVHRTTTIAIEVGELVTAEPQQDVDAISVGSAAAHLRADVLQVGADVHVRDAALGLIGDRLFHRRPAEVIVDRLALENVREHLQQFQDPVLSFQHSRLARVVVAATSRLPTVRRSCVLKGLPAMD